jgi:hypothetical protein
MDVGEIKQNQKLMDEAYELGKKLSSEALEASN